MVLQLSGFTPKWEENPGSCVLTKKLPRKKEKMSPIEESITEEMIQRVQEARNVSRAQAKWIIESHMETPDDVQCCSIPYQVQNHESRSLDEIIDQICRQAR